MNMNKVPQKSGSPAFWLPEDGLSYQLFSGSPKYFDSILKNE